MGQVIYSCFANKKARLQFWNKFHSQRLPNDRLISDLHVCLITISITTDIFDEFVKCKSSTIKDNNLHAYEALVSSNLLKSQLDRLKIVLLPYLLRRTVEQWWHLHHLWDMQPSLPCQILILDSISICTWPSESLKIQGCQ